MEEMRNAHKFLVGKPEGKSHSVYLDVDRRMILEWILGHMVGACGLDSSDSG